MPTNVTGNPNITIVPSPAPAPGALPVVVTPLDGEPGSAASVAEGLVVPANYIAHVQTAVRLDTAVVSVAGSGFTAVTLNLFGGTLTPSGSVKINTGTRFFVKIIAGGAVGVATFQTSLDGGANFGGTQTTSASMVDATSGVTFAFTGTLTTNGTASFRSAYTPLAQWQDAAGNGRYMIDHNGYPTGGRISVVRDEWMVAPGASSSPWGTVLGTAAAIAVQSPVAGYNAPFLKFTPSSTGGATNYAIFTSTQIVMANAAGMSLVMEFEVGLNAAAAGTTSNTTWFWGLDAGVDPGGADVSLVGLLKRYGIANYQFLSGAGAIQVFTNASIATPPTAGTNPTDRIRIELHGSASPLGAYQARFFVNEVYIGTVGAAALPTTTMRMLFGCYNEGGAPSGSPLGYMGPLVTTWNRFTSGPAL